MEIIRIERQYYIKRNIGDSIKILPRKNLAFKQKTYKKEEIITIDMSLMYSYGMRSLQEGLDLSILSL